MHLDLDHGHDHRDDGDSPHSGDEGTCSALSRHVDTDPAATATTVAVAGTAPGATPSAATAAFEVLCHGRGDGVATGLDVSGLRWEGEAR